MATIFTRYRLLLVRVVLPCVAGSAAITGVAVAVTRGPANIVTLRLLGIAAALIVIRQFLLTFAQQAATIARMREVDEMKNGILRAVSHELRTPLTYIKGMSVILEEDGLNMEPDTVQTTYSGLVRNADRLESLLTGLLDLERLTRGVIEPTRTPTNLFELIDRVAVSIPISEDRSIRVRGMKVIADVDPGQIERIVENLLVNAMRHTPAGTNVIASVEPTPEGVLISVDDDGPGLAPELRERVFEPFVQPDESVGRGTGIGLSLVAKFAAVHGGRAWVEEAPTGGAGFRVLLPTEVAA